MKNGTILYLSAILTFPAVLSAAQTAPSARAEAAVADINNRCQKGTLDLLGLISREKDSFAPASGFLSTRMLTSYLACTGSIPEPKLDCGLYRHWEGRAEDLAECEQIKAFNIMAAKVFRSEDAAPACQKALDTAGLVPAEDRPRLCAMLLPAMKTGKTAEFCAKAKAAGIRFNPGHSCLTDMAFLTGKAACDAKHDCHDETIFMDVLRAANPETACAALPPCKAITTRSPAACSPYLISANKDFCAKVAAQAAKDAAARKEKAAAEAAVAASIRKHREDLRAAPKVEEPDLKERLKKKELEVAAAREAALKKSEAEAARHKMVSDIRQQRKAAQMPKNEPPPQFKKGTPLQRVPPEVQKRIEAAEKQRLQDGQ